MNVPLYIAKKYLKSGSTNNAINIINAIAALGIIVGAAALFIVLSVFSGLVNFSLSFSNALDPDLKLTNTVGKTILISNQQLHKIQKINGITAISTVVEDRVLFVFDQKEQVATLKGVDSIFTTVNPIKKSLYTGQWLEPKTPQVVIGYGIAEKLGIGLFDMNNTLEVFVPKAGDGTIENPSQAFNKSALIPVGIYAISEDLDTKYVLTDLELAQQLLGFETQQFSALEIKTNPQVDENEILIQIQKLFHHPIKLTNRAQQNDALYKMLHTENLALYLIFTLVIVIALFNLIGALIMMVLDKKNNLKTLQNLGVEIADLQKIFLYQGTLLSILGGILGLLIGMAVVLIQQHFQLIMITPTLPYPVEFTFQNLLIVMTTIVILGFSASAIASKSVTHKLLK